MRRQDDENAIGTTSVGWGGFVVGVWGGGGGGVSLRTRIPCFGERTKKMAQGDMRCEKEKKKRKNISKEKKLVELES